MNLSQNRQQTTSARVWAWVQSELQSNNLFLLPLRLFIGMGWMRAGVEKLIEPNWYTGEALSAFFQSQMAGNAVYFPFYESLIINIFEPNAFMLSWIIIIGEFLAGAAIMSGTLTNLALFGGLFMNFNFVLAGVVNPSAFYIVIQTALLTGNAGAILGVDSLLSKKVSKVMIAAQPQSDKRILPWRKWGFLTLAISACCVAMAMLPFIRDYGPHSVDDPAMLMFILSALGGLMAMTLYLRMVNREAQSAALAPQPVMALPQKAKQRKSLNIRSAIHDSGIFNPNDSGVFTVG